MPIEIGHVPSDLDRVLERVQTRFQSDYKAALTFLESRPADTTGERFALLLSTLAACSDYLRARGNVSGTLNDALVKLANEMRVI